MNLSEKDYRISGDLDINLINSKLSDIEGDVEVLNLVFENGDQRFEADTVQVSSVFEDDGKKLFKINSDIVKGEIAGVFDIEQIPNNFLAYYHRNFPKFMNKFGLKKPQKEYRNANFRFDFQIDDAGDFAKIIDKGIDSIKGVDLHGVMNTVDDLSLIHI